MKVTAPLASKMRGRQFTLVELLILIAIVTILAALFMPLLNKTVTTARRISCANNMKQQAAIITQYADLYNGMLFSYGLSVEYNIQKGGAYGGRYGPWGPILAAAFPDEWQSWEGVFLCPAASTSIAKLNRSMFTTGGVWFCGYSYGAPVLWQNPDITAANPQGRPTWYYVENGWNWNVDWAFSRPVDPRRLRTTRISRIKHPATTTMLLDSEGGCAPRIFSTAYTTIPVPPAVTYYHPGWRHDFGRNHNFFDGHVGYYPYFGNARRTDIWCVEKQ